MSDNHTNLLIQAKQAQKQSLKESEVLSNQLKLTLETLIQNNSKNDINGPSLLDKITTIHQIDKEITKQLDSDIFNNFSKLIDGKHKLIKRMNKSYKLMKQRNDGNLINDLQKHSELIDQELRILENTVKFIGENKK